MSGRARLLVLGVDAANPDLLERWIADGTLPNLAAIAARGLTGRTRGLDGFFVGSTWPSMYTGTTPARHGFHYQMQLVPGTYDIADRTHGAFVERKPFWRVLSGAGKRVAVLDVPLTAPERAGLNGVHVVEWGGHDAFFGFSARPADLASWIETRWGRHPAGTSCDADGRSAQGHCELVAALEAGIHRKTAWTSELLRRGDWDLFMQVFSESHCVGHQCWHVHDARHPAYDPAVAAVAGDPIRSVYRAIDRAIGEIVALAGDVPCVVFSAHGMSHRYGAHFLLRDLLVALGVAERATPTLGERVRALASRARGTSRGRGIGVVPDRSRCFPVANGLPVSGIRLNRAGREPRGTLAPGDDAARFVERLEADLLAIVNDAAGSPLVSRILHTGDLYQGERLDALPDLLVEWNDRAAIGSAALGGGAGARVIARSPRIGTIACTNDYGRSGDHRPDGWVVAAGPGVRSGALDRQPSLLDLAPTFAAMLGVAMPDVDGTPIAEIVSALAPRDAVP